MKYQYTYQNHFVFGYDDNKFFSDRRYPDQDFSFRYGKVTSSDLTWRAANRLAAQKIRENFEGDLWILYSGGSDSEVCIRAFLEAEIEFKIATLRFQNSLNSHDIEYVEKFSSQIQTPIHYVDIDLEKFWSSPELFRYVDPIQCVSPVLAYHLWLADQVPGVPIIAQGEPYFKKNISADYIPGASTYEPSDWSIVESERLCSLYKHFIKKNAPAIPGFFQYLPEQIYSFSFQNPIMTDLVQNKIIGKLGTRSSKNLMIQQFYPEIELRPKYTGVEKIQALHDHFRSILASRFPHSDANAYLKYEDLRSCLLSTEALADVSPRHPH